MKTNKFHVENINELLVHCSVINIIDPNPEIACKFLLLTYNKSICVTGTQLTQEIMNAIATRTMKELHYKYCEAPFLIIHLNKDDACKTALQQILVFFLSVRQYKSLPTLLLSKERLTEYPLTNESLIGYAHIYDTIRK